MTPDQKQKIIKLREEGMKFSKIAKQLDLSENTIKSFYRRKKLNSAQNISKPLTACQFCGKELAGASRGKARKFCSETCRRQWWKENKEIGNRIAFYETVCAACGKRFKSYGNKNRKYCCHDCYIRQRFEGSILNDETAI